MTTKQTIDGVPRKVLERAVQAIINTSQMHPAPDELRALLDAPAKPLEGLEADNVKLAADRATLSTELETLRKAYRGVLAQLDSAQYQGEPVAWRVTGRGGLTVTPEYPKWAVGERGLTITPLYAEQPAPVLNARTPFEIEKGLDPGEEATFRKWRDDRRNGKCKP